MSKAWYINGSKTQIDAADEIARLFTNHALTEAEGRINSGTIPVIDEFRIREAKAFVDKTQL